VRAIFFDEEHARAAAVRLAAEGWQAGVERERLDEADAARPPLPPLDLPTAPKRIKRP